MSNISDQPVRKPAQSKNADPLKISERQLLLLNTGADIEANEAKDLLFSPDFMTQTSLPVSEPTGNVYVRRNGNFRLQITPAYLDVDGVLTACFPYGAYPRLVLIWMVSEAVRTNSPTLYLGSTLNAFMKTLGLRGDGGARAQMIRRQILAMLQCSIQITHTSRRAGVVRDTFMRLPIASEAELWTREGGHDVERDLSFQSWVRLSPEFFDRLSNKKPAPLDARAIQALSNNALALDIYVWATWRAFGSQGSEVEVEWATLQKQFGSDIKETRFFKRAFLRALVRVKTVYPWLDYEATAAKFILKPTTQTAVKPKRAVRQKTAT